jgi:RNA polymerase sigma-70 factor (ECF subfamily)
MDTLPPQQRLVFDLRFYRQLPFKEIAKILDSAEGTVKTHYRQAVAKLRDHAASRGWN